MTKSTPTEKSWKTPQIEEVTLEAEEDVLATCFTSSMTDRNTGLGNLCSDTKPGIHPCPIYP